MQGEDMDVLASMEDLSGQSLAHMDHKDEVIASLTDALYVHVIETVPVSAEDTVCASPEVQIQS